jgi:hypothetical protein
MHASHSPQFAPKFPIIPRDFSTDPPFWSLVILLVAHGPQTLAPQPLRRLPALSRPGAFHSFVLFSTALHPTPLFCFPIV